MNGLWFRLVSAAAYLEVHGYLAPSYNCTSESPKSPKSVRSRLVPGVSSTLNPKP